MKKVIEQPRGNFIFLPTKRWHEILGKQLDTLGEIAAADIRNPHARFGAYRKLRFHLECAAEILGVTWFDAKPLEALALAHQWIDALAVRRHDLVPFMQDIHGMPHHVMVVDGIQVTVWYIYQPIGETIEPRFRLENPDPDDPHTVAELLYVTGTTQMFYQAIPWGFALKGHRQTRYDISIERLTARATSAIRRADNRFSTAKPVVHQELPDDVEGEDDE